MANYLSTEKRVQIFHLLCEGNGIRSISRIVGCSVNTVSLLMARYASICEYLSGKLITNIKSDCVEADEIRTIVGNSESLRWIFVSLEQKSRMILNFHIGKRDTEHAKIFLSALSKILDQTTPVATDCLKSYVAAVARTPYGRFEAATSSIGLLRAKHTNEQLGWHITNRIESHNGNIRQHVSRLTRKTRCFSKTDIGLKRHLTLFFFYYNFIKKHSALKTTPAVAAGLSDKPFTFDVLIDYDNMYTENPGKRGNYKAKEKKKSIPLDSKLIAMIKSETILINKR